MKIITWNVNRFDNVHDWYSYNIADRNHPIQEVDIKGGRIRPPFSPPLKAYK